MGILRGRLTEMLPWLIAPLLAGFFLTKKGEASEGGTGLPPERSNRAHVANTPVGYRRFDPSHDLLTASMKYSMLADLNAPMGAHIHHKFYMTGVENPGGRGRRVVIFVPASR